MEDTGLGERELRIAPVMTGGTSLAVWMGGATSELYRMLRAHASAAEPAPLDGGQRIYRALLELTATRPRVDVVTGTSAGGLNGVLVGAAWTLGLPSSDFLEIRDTWLEVGELEALLRPVRETNPPSLLEGDDYFVPRIQEVLTRWARDRAPSPERRVDVVTTVTTLTPVPVGRTDDFGESIHEVDHGQWLRFRSDRGDFAGTASLRRLAIAARTSAGLPGVFEPSFLPIGDDDAAESRRPDFADRASFDCSRWAIDGGVVVNLPLGEAIDRIYEQSADVEVRRVVLYVSPTPSAGSPSVADPFATVPDLASSLTAIVTAPRAEGISGDLDRIRERNEQVRRQARARQLVGPWIDHLVGDAQRLDDTFAEYRRQRSRRSVEAMLARLVAGTRQRLPVDHQTVLDTFARRRIDILPEQVDDLGDEEADWGWGIAPVEQALSIALGIIGRTFAQLHAGMPDLAEHRRVLQEARAALHQTREVVQEIREVDARFWQQRFATLGDDLAAADIAELSASLRRTAVLTLLDPWAEASYEAWPNVPGEPTAAPVLERLRHAHAAVARILLVVAPTVTAATADDTAPDVVGRAELARELAAVLPEEGTVEDAQRRLILVHVALTLLLLEVDDREQPVEVMQLSWNSPNHLDPARSPDDKLAGPELARLGAFLKRAWRANDFLWGRMDATHRLARLLLDTDRLRQLGRGRDDVLAALDFLGAPPEDVHTELDRLDDPDDPVTLANTVDWVATALQVEVARQELDHVRDAVARSVRDGANEPDGGRFRTAVERAARADDGLIEPAAVSGLVRKMEIGEETVGTEAGYGPLNRVVTKGSSVLVNLVTGDHSGVPLASRVLQPLRAPLQAVASVVGVLTGGSPLARGLTSLILAASGAVVALAIVDAPVNGAAVAVAATLLTGTVLVAMLRSGFVWLGACAAAATGVIALALTGDDLAAVLYDPPSGGDPAWKQWGFLEPISIARVVLGLLIVDTTVTTVRDWALYDAERRGRRVIGGLAATAVAVAIPWIGEWAFTGEPGSTGWKDRLVDIATDLSAYELEIVLLVLVTSSVLIGLGADLVVSRWYRRLRNRAEPTAPAPTRRRVSG